MIVKVKVCGVTTDLIVFRCRYIFVVVFGFYTLFKTVCACCFCDKNNLQRHSEQFIISKKVQQQKNAKARFFGVL